MADNSKLVFFGIAGVIYTVIYLLKNKNKVRRPTDFTESVSGIIKSYTGGDVMESRVSKIRYSSLGSLRKAFQPHYETHVRPLINTFESKRVEAVSDFNRRIPYAVAFMLVVAVADYFLYSKYLAPDGVVLNSKQSGDPVETAFGIFFFVFCLVAYWVYKPINNYKEDVKAVIFPKILKYFSSDIEYFSLSPRDIYQTNQEACLPLRSLSPLVGDYVSGVYNGTTYELNEVSLSTRGKHRRVVFEGTYIIFSSNKPFSGTTVLKKDAGAVGNFINKDIFGAGRDADGDRMERVELEDPRFEKVFEIYSTDQVEARYLLTTSFMERLLGLSEIYGEGNIQCSFYNGNILLALNTRRKYFEVNSVFRPCTFEEDIDDILIQMNEIFQIIDTLKLDQKIGM